jgi:hypothetical protein
VENTLVADGLVTIVFTDMVDSTVLTMRRRPNAALRSATRR